MTHDEIAKALIIARMYNDLKDDRGLLCRALLALHERQQWRPIESAPRDNHSRLVWCSDRRNTYAVTWSHEGNCWIHFGGLSSPLTETPTHWMPLPDGPEPPHD